MSTRWSIAARVEGGRNAGATRAPWVGVARVNFEGNLPYWLEMVGALLARIPQLCWRCGDFWVRLFSFLTAATPISAEGRAEPPHGEGPKGVQPVHVSIAMCEAAGAPTATVRNM